MINGINNDNNEQMINSRLGGQSEVSQVVTNTIGRNNPYVKENRYNFIDESAISVEAYQIYQHEQDVKHFTKLAMDGMDDTSYIFQVEALFKQGVVDPFTVDDIDLLADSLSKNKDFLKDIEFERS